MKPILIFSAGIVIMSLFSVPVTQAQSTLPAGPVIKAEKEFSRYSVDHNTRDAFVKFMADDGILFRAQEPVNGKKLWESRAADASLLQWWPQYADVSPDGSLGYTTGPWIGKRDRNEPAPGGFGYYSSVWQKQKDGSWKVVVDISIPLPDGLVSTDTVVVTPPAAKKSTGKQTMQEPIARIDSLYNNDLENIGKSFIKERFETSSRIHRREQWPFTDPRNFGVIQEDIKSIRLDCLSGDRGEHAGLAYTYGKAIIIDGEGKEKYQKYLRVWKWIDGQWKIVLDVMG